LRPWLSPYHLDEACASRVLGQLEPDRLSSFALTHGRTIEDLSVWSNVLDPEVHDVAAA
jgi:hypothetical protein